VSFIPAHFARISVLFDLQIGGYGCLGIWFPIDQLEPFLD
jgi:hypothetical protein